MFRMALAFFLFFSFSTSHAATQEQLKKEIYLNYLGYKFKNGSPDQVSRDLAQWIPEKNRKYFHKKYGNKKLFDKAKVKGNSVLLHLNGVTKKLEVIDIEKGIFRFDGTRFQVKPQTPVEEIFNIIAKVTSPKISGYNPFIESAHADGGASVVAGAVIAIVISLGVAYWVIDNTLKHVQGCKKGGGIEGHRKALGKTVRGLASRESYKVENRGGNCVVIRVSDAGMKDMKAANPNIEFAEVKRAPNGLDSPIQYQKNDNASNPIIGDDDAA